MSAIVQYPAEGCIVEYLESNAVQIAMILEANEKRVRLLLPNRRELNLSRSRLLPWAGPVYGANESRDTCVRLLEQHKAERARQSASILIQSVWEMVAGEMREAQAQWFAELENTDPSVDTIAAYAHALLAHKTHFRFQPPYFQIFTEEEVEKRLAEQQARIDREALIVKGHTFFLELWDVYVGKRSLADIHLPPESVAQDLEQLLTTRMRNPMQVDANALWANLTRGIPDDPFVALKLLMAWEKVPPHYNVWLAMTEYAEGDTWWEPYRESVLALAAGAEALDGLSVCDLPFVSIDSSHTRDIDDAFALAKEGDTWIVTVALAFPALAWPFDTAFDKAVLERGSSLYLPEATCHMLPECLGTNSYSLIANAKRPAFLVEVRVDASGKIEQTKPFLGAVCVRANLTYSDCEEVLSKDDAENPASPYREQLRLCHAFAQARQQERIRSGAVLMERPEPEIVLEGTGRATRVDLVCEDAPEASQQMVSECMICASAGCAQWAHDRDVPLIHRTQDIPIPQEYAGMWTAPERIAQIMHALSASLLEVESARHAALGVAIYAPITSPLRRYADLCNIAQIASVLAQGSPRFTKAALNKRLEQLLCALEQVSLVQRMRPRYWKLLYFKQQGDGVWWPAVIVEENDMQGVICLPKQALTLRVKRQMLPDRAYLGMEVRVRLGKIQPYANEIQILEVVTD